MKTVTGLQERPSDTWQKKECNVMTKEQFEREKNYQTSVALAKNLLRKGIISEKDYRKIDTILIQKYRPIFGII